MYLILLKYGKISITTKNQLEINFVVPRTDMNRCSGLDISVCFLLLLHLFHAALSAPLVDLVHLMQNKH